MRVPHVLSSVHYSIDRELAVLDESLVNPAGLSAVGCPDIVSAYLVGLNAENCSSGDAGDLVLILEAGMIAKCKIMFLNYASC